MKGQVRVLVYAFTPNADPAAIEAAYHRASHNLAGVSGLIGNQLLRSVHDPNRFLVMSEWESLDAFRAWEGGSLHREATAPLRPLQDRERNDTFGVYQVSAEYY